MRAGHEEGSDRIALGLASACCLGSWTFAPALGLLSPSPPIAQLLGLDPRAIRPAPVLAGVHPDDRVRVESVLVAASASGGPFEVEFRAGSPTRWLRLMGRAERGAGHRARLHGLAFDLTDLRTGAGPARQRRQRQLNQLAEHVVASAAIVERLRHPGLAQMIRRIARATGQELARHVPEPGLHEH